MSGEAQLEEGSPWQGQGGSWWGYFALAFGVAGSACVQAAPVLGLAAFVLAGLALAWSTREAPSRGFGAGPWAAAPLERWEPYFFALLALGLAAVRFHGLGDWPAGVHGHEGEMFAQIQYLSQAPYTPHVGDDDILWPSMAFYQALGAGRLLGFSVQALRLPSAVLDYLAALGMYFLARRITSPYSAAVISVLFAGNVIMMGMGRNLFPGALLLLGSVVALYFTLKGLQDREPRTFALGGMGLGLCLHGFVPGRAYFGLFVAWFLWLALFHKGIAPGRKMLVCFWAAAALTAAPVLLWACFNWSHYWNYVREQNTWGGQGLLGYARGFREIAPIYVRAFHVYGDPASVDAIAFKPFLDLPSGLLFGAGFFACLALFWRPLPALLLGGLLLSLLPAIMGGGFAHPTARRSILAFPHVYLIAALGLEQLRAGVGPKLRTFALPVALAALAWACWSYGCNVRDYAAFLARPDIMGRFDHKAYLAGRAMRAHPDSQLRVSNIVLEGVEAAMLTPPLDRSAQVGTGYDGLLSFVPEGGKDLLFLMEGLNSGWEGLLRRIYPDVRIQEDAAPSLPDGMTTYSDPTTPSLFLVEAEVPAAEAGNLRGLLLGGPGGALGKVDAFDPAFAARYRGRTLNLVGRLVGGQRSTVLLGGVQWPHWRVRVEGVSLGAGQGAKLPAGVLRIELEGTVPEGAVGPLPLKLTEEGDDLVSEGRILAYDGPEVDLDMTGGPRTWDRPVEVERKDLLPLRRFFDITELPVPFSGRMRFTFAVPEDGTYEFSENPYTPPVGRLRLDGATAYGNLGQDQQNPVLTPLTLRKGRRVRAVMDQVIPSDGDLARSMALYVRREGDAQWQFLPYEWLRP